MGTVGELVYSPDVAPGAGRGETDAFLQPLRRGGVAQLAAVQTAVDHDAVRAPERVVELPEARLGKV